MTLVCRNLEVAVPGRSLVRELDLEITPGAFVAVLGRNGTGKSLTLHTLAGLRPANAGQVDLGGRALSALDRRQVARHLALLPQHSDDAFPATVLDTALSGRHPHIPPLQWESAEDRRIAADALRQVDLQGLESRDVTTLSGGERRRLAIAQVLTQAPDVFLLDEPTNHLDPQHQLDVLDLFASRVQAGASVLVSLHDANLAARYASDCLLLFGDGRWRLGPVSTTLTADALSELYATPIEAVPWQGGKLFVPGLRGQAT